MSDDRGVCPRCRKSVRVRVVNGRRYWVHDDTGSAGSDVGGVHNVNQYADDMIALADREDTGPLCGAIGRSGGVCANRKGHRANGGRDNDGHYYVARPAPVVTR